MQEHFAEAWIGKSALQSGLFQNYLRAFAGLALLLGLSVATWFLISGAVSFLTDVDKTVASAIIAGLVAIFSIVFTFWKERSNARREAHREKKIEVYTIFVDMIFDVVRKSKKDKELEKYLSKGDFEDRFIDLMRGVVFYGSPNVIKALSDWKLDASNHEDAGINIRKIGTILLAMRKDIGLSNFGLDEMSINQIYIVDDLRDNK